MKRRRFSVLRIFHSRGDVSSAHSVKQQREASANEPLRVNRDRSHHTSRITGGDMYVRVISSSTALKTHRKYINIKVAVCRDCMCMYVFFGGQGGSLGEGEEVGTGYDITPSSPHQLKEMERRRLSPDYIWRLVARFENKNTTHSGKDLETYG